MGGGPGSQTQGGDRGVELRSAHIRESEQLCSQALRSGWHLGQTALMAQRPRATLFWQSPQTPRVSLPRPPLARTFSCDTRASEGRVQVCVPHIEKHGGLREDFERKPKSGPRSGDESP